MGICLQARPHCLPRRCLRWRCSLLPEALPESWQVLAGTTANIPKGGTNIGSGLTCSYRVTVSPSRLHCGLGALCPALQCVAWTPRTTVFACFLLCPTVHPKEGGCPRTFAGGPTSACTPVQVPDPPPSDPYFSQLSLFSSTRSVSRCLPVAGLSAKSFLLFVSQVGGTTGHIESEVRNKTVPSVKRPIEVAR